MDGRFTEGHLGCAVAAILAVNQYPLQKAQDLLPALQQRGLLSPSRVGAMSLEAVISGLVDAGYDRGKLTWMFAERLQALMGAFDAGRIDPLADALAQRDREAGMRTLIAVKGIGPQVARTAWELLTRL